MIVAILVTPAATAYLLTHRLSTMMLLAAIFASLSGVIGLYLSFYLSIAFDGAIVLTTITFFMIALCGGNCVKSKLLKSAIISV